MSAPKAQSLESVSIQKHCVFPPKSAADLSSGGSRGGGGVQGVRTPPPLLGHDVGFLTLGPKLDPLLDPPPPFFACIPKMDPSGGSRVCVCQEWGCFSIFLRADDGTRTMSKGGGVLVKNPVSAPAPPPFQKSWIRPCLVVFPTYRVRS